MLKFVEYVNDTRTAVPGDWQLSATPEAGVENLATAEVAGASTLGGNVVPVRPGHTYTLDEDGPGGYTQVALEKFNGDDPNDPAQFDNHGNWEQIKGSDITVASGEQGVYRFVNREVKAFELPFTGGAGTWPYALGGALIAALALLAGLITRRQRANR
ncbi:LPXTG cell wall anchor domain-containing protein [Glutamicibacter creatinolyticus]|uniref:LPXTG cell wall anchor domain-containing protein n=1 Tax=Glutamicibacter creatinolyticus TaxID=162496 RepID=UPI0037C0165B